jgi:hypothetical protein
MFDDLADAIAEAHIPVDRTAVVEAIRLSDRLGARVSEAVGRLDSALAPLARRPDDPTLAVWLRRQARLSYADAERLVFTAQRLRQWPLTRRAWLDGVLSGGQVGAVVANVPPAATLRYANDESEVVPVLIGLSVTDTAAALRRWASGHDPNGR